MNDRSTTKSTAALPGLVRGRAEGPCMETCKGLGTDRPAPVGGPAGVADKGNAFAVTLPWPPKELSPNARTHWRKKAPITKAYKSACWALAMEAKFPEFEWDGVGKVHVWIDFYPPDRRHRDDDNMISSFKAGRDGIALALGIDDKHFRCYPYVQDSIGGMVKVRITNGPQA